MKIQHLLPFQGLPEPPGSAQDAPRPVVGRYLRLVPVAIFTALIVPGLAAPDGELSVGPELAAGAVGLLVALATRNVLATLGLGYAAFMALEGMN